MKYINKKKGLFSVLAVAVALAVVLSGCGAEKANEYNKYLKSDSSTVSVEDDKDKAADKADNKDADKATDQKKDSDKSSAADADKSDKNSNAGNSNSGSSNKDAGNSGSANKPSNGGSTGNSGSSNQGNAGNSNSGSANKPSNPGNSGNSGGGNNKPAEPEKPAHQHNYTTVVSSTPGNCSHDGSVTKQCSCGATQTFGTGRGDHHWVNDTKTINHPAETKPVYVGYHLCKKCGYKTYDDDDILRHILQCGGTYTTLKEIDHYETIRDAWTETIPNGQKCDICGAHS